MNVKYLRDSGIFYSKSRPGLSLVDRYAESKIYIPVCGRRMQVGDEKMTSFWCVAWCRLNLEDSFCDIFDICNEQNITIADAATLC
jgi:hypothetical protein